MDFGSIGWGFDSLRVYSAKTSRSQSRSNPIGRAVFHASLNGSSRWHADCWDPTTETAGSTDTELTSLAGGRVGGWRHRLVGVVQ